MQEFFLNAAIGAMGPGALRGLIPEYLSRISVDECYRYIKSNKCLCEQIDSSGWIKLRVLAHKCAFDLTFADVITELQKNRLDVLSCILNTPGGREWLARQVDDIKQKLAS